MLIQGQVGQPSTTSIAAGTNPTLRQGQLGDLIASELHGRFYEQVYRNNVFSTGSTSLVALSANTITLTATTTPILGVYNPTTSTVNLVLLQAALALVPNTLTTPVGPGAIVGGVSVGNGAVSTGLTPWSRKTLTQAGSQAKGFAGSTALTGLTNNLTLIEGYGELLNASAQTYGTLAATSPIGSYGGVINFDGQIIVPPGGVFALLNVTSTTTFSHSGRLLWEEVPL